MTEIEANFVNISAYKFIHISEDKLADIREILRSRTREMGLKGTVLLGTEGINLFVAAELEVIDKFKALLAEFPHFQNLKFKVSYSKSVPYKRMLVKVKQEIIAMGHNDIVPLEFTAPHIEPEMLKKWYQEGKDMILLDARNEYEVQLGTFQNAIHFKIRNFRQFPEAVETLDADLKNKPIVTFCTGGIRCEKAAALMLKKGFKEVYQLEGGIINYFEKCGGEYYQGDCFVFDKRIGVDPNLQETDIIQCYKCRAPVTEAQKFSETCPYCGDAEMKDRWAASVSKSI